ncbi:Na(+)-translocating NADH-quinone reductase subunit A [hydrothermal vent metagenome]|uniref:Na(+)-translocating NADH-quinone reductase subunit A n=1 Tax=hydrothermal vent metagenome TaxID=652676 RepID=A0A3B1E0S2_9ZZZZ
MKRIKQGLNIPITGEPEQKISMARAVSRVALVANDYVGMKPTMVVAVGDSVKLGQRLFEDKKTPGVWFTSPGCGKVVEINRGAKRAFQSVVIALEGDEGESFLAYSESDLAGLASHQVRENLVNSGLWTTLRTRPYSKVPCPKLSPHSVFVTAMDTNPLSVESHIVISENEKSFRAGLQILKCLTEGTVFLCKAPGKILPVDGLDFLRTEEFDGPHPAGLPGTHIHFLDPVSEKKTVWYINYQDVIAIGTLFLTGQLSTERVIALAGPAVQKPRLLATRVGASIEELVENELVEGETRLISGSVLSGRIAMGSVAYLGRFDLQVSALLEGRTREFLGWQKPGFDKFSIMRVFASAFLGGEGKFPLTTAMNGSHRAMVPIGAFEKVMPMDILPTFLLRALMTENTDQAQALGCLELDEEDLALCTFVCPGKEEYGPLLRKCLTAIEKEG